MRLPIPPPGRPQPIILLFSRILVKEATPFRRRARARNRPPRARRADAPPTSTRRSCRRAPRSSPRCVRPASRCRPQSSRARWRSIGARAMRSSAASTRCSATASCSRTARASFASSPSSISSPAPCRAIRTASASSCPDDGGADLFLDPREMHKVLHGDRATARRTGTDRRGRPEGEIVDVLERANRDDRRPAATRSAASRSSSPRTVGSTRTCSCRPASAARRSRAMSSSSRSSSSPRRSARRSPASIEVLGSYTDPGMEIEIALRKHDLPHEFSRGRRAAGRASCRRRCAPPTARGASTSPRLPLVTIDGETAKDFDDAVYCERKGKGFRLIVAIADVSHYVRDGDALDRDARERGTSVYFPRRVIPMLPEALSNELCSLKPEVDRLCMVCDMDIDARGRDRELPVLPGGDALARAAHLHAGLGLALAARRPRRARRRRCCRTSKTSTRSTTRSRRRAKRAARSTSTRSRCSSSSTSSGKIVRDRAGRAQRRAQADRGMHARGQRLHRGVPRAAQASRALPRARGPDAGEARRAARFPRELRAVAAGRRRPDRVRLRAAAARDQGSSRLRAAADGAAALAAAGALPARQRRPLRPLVRGVRALHVADPPLSGPSRPPRDQGRARGHASTSPAARRGPSSACTARSPSGAPTTRRATSRTGSSATSCRTRSARASTARSAA